MKRVEHYICDICHTEYNDKLTCQNCEKSHKKPKDFIGQKYIAYTQAVCQPNYPVWIDVEFEDGRTKRYKR